MKFFGTMCDSSWQQMQSDFMFCDSYLTVRLMAVLSHTNALCHGSIRGQYEILLLCVNQFISS